jgi:putative tryptophan/tyrosine transport system substrate-binding protein
VTFLKRREFIALGGAAATWPLAARAQKPMPIIGYLTYGSDISPQAREAFREGLGEAGFIEDQNVAIEYRFADGEFGRLPAMADYLVRRKVAVIVATGALASALAAKAATSTIPIVFLTGGDPVKYGLVPSLSRPGGNITGFAFFAAELSGKRVELLCEMVPQAKTIAFLSGGPRFGFFEEEWTNVLAVTNALGRKLAMLYAPTSFDIDAAFTTLAQRQAEALIVGVNPHLALAWNKILALAAHYKVPGMYVGSGWCHGGGLMSYAAEGLAPYHLVGSQYVGKILKGAKPADLPVQQPTKFELVINLKTARSLGISVPPDLLARADQVIN